MPVVLIKGLCRVRISVIGIPYRKKERRNEGKKEGKKEMGKRKKESPEVVTLRGENQSCSMGLKFVYLSPHCL